jgi:hypothetical protein
MTEINPFRGTNFLCAVYSFFDFSLAGRILPLYVPKEIFTAAFATSLNWARLALTFFVDTRQLRPLGPFDDLEKWLENRKYSDNPLIPYLNTYDIFAIPITFSPDFFEQLQAAPNPAEIFSVRSIFLGCELESPIKGKDDDNATAYRYTDSRTGKSYKKKPKINYSDYYDDAKLLWKPALCQEPAVFGVLPVPMSVVATLGGEVIYPTAPAPSLGLEFTYFITGYFTERNFFDREWITEWGVITDGTSLPYRIKVDCFGAYFQDPNTYTNAGNKGTDIAATELEDKHWIKFTSWDVDDFYEPDFGKATWIDNSRIERYVRGATKVLQYKPSEIGSLRFYFYFYVEADVYSPISIMDHICHLTVKYNNKIAEERIKYMYAEEDANQKRCPFLNEATVMQLTAEHYGFPNVEAYLEYKYAIGSNFGGGYLNNPRTNPNPNV